jgi:hypothetical protein
VKKNKNEDSLSKESRKILYHIMGVYGKTSLDETVKQIGEDFRAIFPIKYEFDYDDSKNIREVFVQMHDDYKSTKQSLENILQAKDNNFLQSLLFQTWDIDPAVPVIYQLAKSRGFEGTMFEFVSKAAIETFKEKHWNVKYYYNNELGSMQPIIVDPRGKEFKF